MFQSCLWGPVNLGRCQLNWSSTHLKICMGVQFDSGCVMNMTKALSTCGDEMLVVLDRMPSCFLKRLQS